MCPTGCENKKQTKNPTTALKVTESKENPIMSLFVFLLFLLQKSHAQYENKTVMKEYQLSRNGT